MELSNKNEVATKWLEAFNQLILRNISDPNLTNALIAIKLRISIRELYRIVQKLTGQSPNSYIRSIRLRIAYELLESGQYNTVKEVAVKVGFKKADYFTILFKTQYERRPVEVLRRKE
jgi:transcriptional regulator GlxA family with amidase domain